MSEFEYEGANRCNKQGISGIGVWGDRVEAHQSIETRTFGQARWIIAARDHRFPKSRSPQASQVARRIDRRFAWMGDQRPQLSMIDSAGKRDTILRPSLSLQPNRQSNRALCGLHGFDPQVLQRGPGDRSIFIGGLLRHAEHYVTETLPKHAHGLDRRCDLSCIRLVHVF
jgi:hypothetical protein